MKGYGNHEVYVQYVVVETKEMKASSNMLPQPQRVNNDHKELEGQRRHSFQ
jgi:hypothetical protein